MDMPGGPGSRSYGTAAGHGSMVTAARTNLNIQAAFSKSGMIGGGMEDPLLHRGNTALHKSRVEAQERALKVVHSTVIALVPFSFFCSSLVFTIWATGTSYPNETLLMYIACVMGLVVYATAIVRSQGEKETKTKWRRWTGRLAQVATIVGVLVGQCVFYKHFVFYHTYMGMNTYTNIAVSQSVDQFVDAGMIAFTSDTTLDVTRAVGFKSATADVMICVAPVVDSSMSLDQEVHFFAVGVGCCEPRSSFLCDDALDGSTKNALMMLEARMLTSPFMEWAVAGAVDRAGFDAAIRMQSAAFGTAVAKKTRLLYWTKDPRVLATQYYSRGLEDSIIAIVVYFFVSVLVTWHHMFAPKWLMCE